MSPSSVFSTLFQNTPAKGIHQKVEAPAVKTPIRANARTSELALAALNNSELWPDLVPLKGSSLKNRKAVRKAQNDRVAAVEASKALAETNGVFK